MIKHLLPPSQVSSWKRLHLGADTTVKLDDIIGIFDMDSATVSPVTKKYLNTAQRRDCVQLVADELPKSFVVAKKRPCMMQSAVCRKKRNRADAVPVPQTAGAGKEGAAHAEWAKHEQETVYLSQLAPATLLQRSSTSHAGC